MNRRSFLAAAPALLGAASCSQMNLLNIQPLGIVEGGQFIVIRADQVTNPQVYSYTVPADMCFELWTANFQFSTSAVVATRQAFINIQQGNDVIWSKIANSPINASSTLRLWFGLESPETAVVSGNIWQSLPRIAVPPLGTVQLSATSLQLGDITSAICLSGRMWPIRQ